MFDNSNLSAARNSSSACFELFVDASGAVFEIVRVAIGSLLATLTFIANTVLLCLLRRANTSTTIKKYCHGFYLINLCIIGLCSTIVSAICIILYKFSDTCDKFTGFWKVIITFQIMLSSGWIATIAVMIMERCLVAKNPLRKRKTLRRTKYKLYLVWVWAIINALPHLLLYEYVKIGVHWSCYINPRWSIYGQLYSLVLLTSLFFIPTIIIILSSLGLLAPRSCESALTLKRKKGHQRFVSFIALLWLTFFCSYLPILLFQSSISFKLSKYHMCQADVEHIFISLLLMSWLIYLFMPIHYCAIYGKLLRKEVKKIDKSKPARMVQSLITSTNIRRVSVFTNKSARASRIDSGLTESLFGSIGMLDGDMIQQITFDLSNENGHGNRCSLAVDTGRRTSIFRRKSNALDNVFNTLEEQLLSSKAPTCNHTVNKLNQRASIIPKRLTRELTNSF